MSLQHISPSLIFFILTKTFPKSLMTSFLPIKVGHIPMIVTIAEVVVEVEVKGATAIADLEAMTDGPGM